MGCTATRCKNCKRSIRACEKVVANNGTSCCKHCVLTYNNKNK